MGESLVIKGDDWGGVALIGELGVIDVVVTVEGVHGGWVMVGFHISV